MANGTEGNGAKAALMEGWFKWVLSILLSVLAFLGVVLWDKVDALNTSAVVLTNTVSTLDGSIRTEIQARSDLSGRVDGLTGPVQGLSDKFDRATVPQSQEQVDMSTAKLNRQLDKMSQQMYHLQAQLDEAASERNRKKAKQP